MTKKYATGHISLVFLATEENAKLLLNSLYDSVVLLDSATGAMAELEIASLDINSAVLLGDDEFDDVRLA